MDREIVTLERETIPGLDRCRLSLESVLTGLAQQRLDNENMLTKVAKSIDALAHGAVNTSDVAIATRIVRGPDSSTDVRTALSRTGRDIRTSWDEIAAIVQQLHGHTVDELRRSKRRLELLKDQERTSRRPGRP